MARRALTALLLCAALVVGQAVQGPVATAPIFAWGDKPYFGSNKAETKYQVLSDARVVVKDLLNPLLQPAAQSAVPQPSVVVVFVGSQLRASDLRKASQQEALAPLSAALAAAGASVSLPFVTKAADAGPLADAVAALPNAQPLACGSAGLEALKAALAAPAPANGPLVLRMCASLPADAAGAPAGVQAELQQLLQMNEALAASGRSHVAVFASDPAHDAPLPAPRGRSLLQDVTGFGPYTVCGPLCQSHVHWLQGILALGILATATSLGLVCLYVLDAPTKFQAHKEAQQ